MYTTLFLNLEVYSNKKFQQFMCVFINIQNSNFHGTSALNNASRSNLQNKVLMG